MSPEWVGYSSRLYKIGGPQQELGGGVAVFQLLLLVT